MRSPGIGRVLLILSLPLVSYAELYQWRDEQGQVHFSDQAPADRVVQASPLPEVHNGYQPVQTPLAATPPAGQKVRAQRQQRALSVEKAEQKKRQKEEKCKDLRLKARLNSLSRSGTSDLKSLMKKQRKREKLWADIRRYCH